MWSEVWAVRNASQAPDLCSSRRLIHDQTLIHDLAHDPNEHAKARKYNSLQPLPPPPYHITVPSMANLIDGDASAERFNGYEAELKLVQADLSQQLEQIKETTGEARKAAIGRAERGLEDAQDLVRLFRLPRL